MNRNWNNTELNKDFALIYREHLQSRNEIYNMLATADM